jgi:class 3 adenylate cyclase
VNSGEAVVRELGGEGYVAYAVVGDTVNTGSRLEGQAPVGRVLIGAGTNSRLPSSAVVEHVPGLRVKGEGRRGRRLSAARPVNRRRC